MDFDEAEDMQYFLKDKLDSESYINHLMSLAKNEYFQKGLHEYSLIESSEHFLKLVKKMVKTNEIEKNNAAFLVFGGAIHDIGKNGTTPETKHLLETAKRYGLLNDEGKDNLHPEIYLDLIDHANAYYTEKQNEKNPGEVTMMTKGPFTNELVKRKPRITKVFAPELLEM